MRRMLGRFGASAALIVLTCVIWMTPVRADEIVYVRCVGTWYAGGDVICYECDGELEGGITSWCENVWFEYDQCDGNCRPYRCYNIFDTVYSCYLLPLALPPYFITYCPSARVSGVICE